MTTTVLRLAAPLMSWGHRSDFLHRYSASDPTLSAIQGLLLSALGVGRHQPIPDEVRRLDPVLRVERPGTTLRDFHTVNPLDTDADRRLAPLLDGLEGRARSNVARRLTVVAKADGKPEESPVVTERYYRADAEYLVLLDDPSGHFHAALALPVWTLFAGRKACVLDTPYLLGRVELNPPEAARRLPVVGEAAAQREIVSFGDPGDAVRTETRNDRMVAHRTYAPQQRWYSLTTVTDSRDDWFTVAHDLGHTHKAAS